MVWRGVVSKRDGQDIEHPYASVHAHQPGAVGEVKHSRGSARGIHLERGRGAQRVCLGSLNARDEQKHGFLKVEVWRVVEREGVCLL